MMLKQRISAAILAGITALTLTACGGSAPSAEDTGAASGSAAESNNGELTPLRVAIMTNESSQWYAVIGDETGIFAEHGIQAEITEFAAGVNTIDAVVTGQADVGNLADYAAVNRIGNTQDAGNLRILTRYSSGSNGNLYVDSKKITSLKDLAGQPFVTQPGTVWDYWNAKTYEAAGIGEKDQNIINADSAASGVALLTTGQAAAMWANGTNAAKLEEAGLKALTTLADLDLTIDAYFITTDTFVQEQPELVKEYLAALQDVADWIKENPEETAEILEKRADIPKEQTISNLESYSLTLDFPQSTLDHLNDIKKWAVDRGSFTDYEIADYVDLTALKAAVPDADSIDD